MIFDARFAERFFEITGYDVVDFLERYVIFVETQYTNIDDFFSGDIPDLEVSVYENLQQLTRDALLIKTQFKLNAEALAGIGYWELLDTVETVYLRLLTILNTPKYSRASAQRANFTPNAQFDYILKQNQTLEGVLQNVLLSEDPQNAWARLAIENDLRETDYGPEGQVNLRVNLESGERLSLESVVDTMDGDNMYGRDFSHQLSFVDDDLQVLSPVDTFRQSVRTVAALLKADIPEYPDLGVDPRLVIGNNTASIFYGSILRQLDEAVATDDTIVSFKVDRLNLDGQSSVYIDFTATSYRSMVLNETASFGEVTANG